MDDIDALKITLIYFADRVLNGRKRHCQINFSLLNEVDDINNFGNALTDKDEKFKKSRFQKLNHKIKRCNVYGFTSGVQDFWIN